jgi:Tfp pilus assembly protein PilN
VFRTNLATRPFYNERAAHVLIGIAAAVVLAITALNVIQIISLSRHNTELSARVNADRAETERLSAEAARIRKTIDRDELASVVAAAQEANALIDQRTFSWTEFFNQIESTMPPDVMLTAVRPSFKDGVTRVAMSVLAREAVDLEDFMDKLDDTGFFTDVVPSSQDRTDDGLFRALIESVYVGPTEAAAGAETASETATSKGERDGATAAPSRGEGPPSVRPQRGGGRQ